MPVWDDDLRELHTRQAVGDAVTPEPAPPAAQRHRTLDDVRSAARQDAADIVTRARRDIRKVVADARHELLELSAQVEAANTEQPTDAPVTYAALAPEEADELVSEAWLGMSSERQQPAPAWLAPDDEASTPASPAKAFVVLFALVGLLVVAGTAWWLTRTPARAPAVTSSGALPAAPSPAEPEVALATAASGPSPGTEPAAAKTDTLTIALEAERETWVRTSVDGDGDAGRIYAPGEKRLIEGARDVSIRAGDAGGLLVSLDGEPAAPFGPDGVSLTRRFSRTRTAPPSEAPPAVPASPPATAAPPRAEPALSPRPSPVPVPAPLPVAPSSPIGVPASPTARGTVLTTPASAAAAASPPPQTQASGRGSVPAARIDIAASSRQWLDAYHRQDRAAMDPLGAPSLAVNDERRPDQRFPFGLEVTRTFENEQLQLAGDIATFTARMTEHAATGAQVSRVSQTWVRRSGNWQLQEARIAPDSQAQAAEQ